MKLAWLTDIHLNFLKKESRDAFYNDILKTNCDAVLITGDIAEATSIAAILQEMASQLLKPIYLMLGNHDYYQGSVDDVRRDINKLCQKEKFLFWLPNSGPQLLKNSVVLLGQDGWADGRYGDYINSPVTLNDSRMIADLFQAKIIGKFPLLEKMQQLADEDAKALSASLVTTIKQYSPKRIIILTHVPPFKEACLYEGKISGNDFLPFFASKAMGDVLLQAATNNPNVMFDVLCGHTHCKAHYQPCNNLMVKVGQAEYMRPEIQEIVNV